jgi:hypothetical protein
MREILKSNETSLDVTVTTTNSHAVACWSKLAKICHRKLLKQNS